MRFFYILLLSTIYITAWSQDNSPNIGFLEAIPFDRIITCIDPHYTTALPFLGLGANCNLRAFNSIRVVAPEMDMIINSDQNPALLQQASAYQAINLNYTPWQAGFSSTNVYAFKASIQKQFRKGSSWDLRYENFSMSPSFGISDNSPTNFFPTMKVLRLAYANKLSKHWSIGIATKYASQKPKDEFFFIQAVRKVNTLAADIGFKYQNRKVLSEQQTLSWQWGFSLSNLGPKVQSELENNFWHPLPTTLSAGGLIEQEIHLQNTAILRIRGSYQINKLLVPTFCADCDDNLNFIPDHYEYSALGGMLVSFTDAPGGLSEELKEINHQFDMGATYKLNSKFSLRTQLTLFYQHPEKGAIQYFTTMVGMQWGRIQFNLNHYSPTYLSDSSKASISLGYQHFLTPS